MALPTLLYAYETWIVYQRHAKRLNHFHISCLRKLLKIKWQDKIPDMEVLKKAGMQSMHTVLKLAQLRWAGHVIRMPDERLQNNVFFGELQEGKSSQGGQTNDHILYISLFEISDLLTKYREFPSLFNYSPYLYVLFICFHIYNVSHVFSLTQSPSRNIKVDHVLLI